jgi:hypothetical protein
MEEGKAGFKMCRFKLEVRLHLLSHPTHASHVLQRCTDVGQAPLPLHITGEGQTDKYWSPDGPETLAAPRQSRSGNTNSAPRRTVQQRNQEIAGRRRLPRNINFRKPKPVASDTTTA